MNESNVGMMITITSAHAPSQQALNDLLLVRDPEFSGEPYAAFIGESMHVQIYPDVPAPEWLQPIADWALTAGYDMVVFMPGGVHHHLFPVYGW